MLVNNGQDFNTTQAHVQLITRVRPLYQSDQIFPTSYFQVDPTRGAIVLGGNRLFNFDHVLPFNCPQHVLYKSYVEPPVNACFEGYDISVIVYGQTGSGKTYTVFGPGLLYTMNEADFGMVPRAVRHIFCKLKEYPGRQFSIQTSYLEIYDEEIRDLLSGEPFHGEITVGEDVNGKTIVNGATRVECQTIDDVFSCLETGLALRHTGPTTLNQLSGRSHGIFTIYIQQAWTQDGCIFEVSSKLHFVDLAGSERLSGNLNNGEGSLHPAGFQEPGMPINSGLLALSNVTAALGDPRRKASHQVPYWDSKLTCILKDSLGGSAFTVLIVCLSPSASDVEENINTLTFATRAANICNRPILNVRVTPLATIPLQPTPFRPQHAMMAGHVSDVPEQNQNSLVNTEPQPSSNEDVLEDELFKLRFAASQWQLLVTNAETLLNELSTAGTLAEETLNRIESWLCLKEEYSHCIDPDLYAIRPRSQRNSVSSTNSSPGSFRSSATSSHFQSKSDSKALHVIEEVSEPTPTHELTSSLTEDSASSSDDSSSDGSHFSEQLDVLRQQFRETTDRLISTIETTYDAPLAQEWDQMPNQPSLSNLTLKNNVNNNESSPSENLNRSGLPNVGRRISIFGPSNPTDRPSLMGIAERRESGSKSSCSFRSSEDEEDVKKELVESEPEDEIRQEMRRLSETSESRRLQVWQTNNQLQKAQQTLKELRQAIKMKEEFIADLAQAGRESELSKQRFEEKIERLEQDAAQTRSDLAAAQIRLKDLEEKSQRQKNDGDDENKDEESEDEESHCERISRHHQEIARYETRLKEMAKLLDLTGRSPRKVDELERSLCIMKEQQSFLKDQLRQETERKKELKLELEKDHQRIVALERQLREKRRAGRRKSLEGLEGGTSGSAGESELEHKWRWLVAEEERLVELRTAMQWQSEELEERQSVLEKREMALDRSHPASDAEGGRQTSTSSGARRKNLNESTDDKMIQTSTASPFDAKADEIQDKEAIRKEIRNMRHTRDSLVQQRQELDERQHRGRELEPEEERRMLELDEAIEAVDAAMEYKNELICSRHFELKNSTEDGLLTRLMSLSHAETRSLLCKYFQKVIDLREGSKKMEQQFAELEAQYEDQSRYVRKLSVALKHTQLGMEKRSSTLQRNYEHHRDATSHLKQLTGDLNAGADSGDPYRKLRHHHQQAEQQQHHHHALAQRDEQRDLRRHLRDLLSITTESSNGKHHAIGATGGASGVEVAPSTCSSRTPSLKGLHAVQALHQKITGLQRMKGRQTGPATTTTVTREKNKLIIKQQPLQQQQPPDQVRESSSKRRQR